MGDSWAAVEADEWGFGGGERAPDPVGSFAFEASWWVAEGNPAGVCRRRVGTYLTWWWWVRVRHRCGEGGGGECEV